MKAINEQTSLLELAAIVSETLHQAGIDAVLSGGAVVSIYSESAYQSYGLNRPLRCQPPHPSLDCNTE